VLYTQDSIEFLKNQPDYSADIIFADPPYALGSDVIIRTDGKVDYKNAVDFMNKWQMPTGEYWEQWFKESYRTLKYGGYCLVFGMDRQLLLFKYYANLVGFSENQSLYWYNIQSFPKSSSLSKNLDKHFGAEREIVGKTNNVYDNCVRNPNNHKSPAELSNVGKWGLNSSPHGLPLTESSTDLAKKYDNYKYSIAPLKQNLETIMVFQKPYKTKSCLHDVLAYENGDAQCCCGALNIEENRVPLNGEKNPTGSAKKVFAKNQFNNEKSYGDNKETPDDGRYPSQTFIDEGAAEILDKQKSTVIGGSVTVGTEQGFGCSDNCYGSGKHNNGFTAYNDSGGVSKILHKCKYELDECDILQYCSKVSSGERNAGLEDFVGKLDIGKYGSSHDEIASLIKSSGSLIKWWLKCNKCNLPIIDYKKCQCEQPEYAWKIDLSQIKNNHPTLKPISLIHKILNLFKTPNPQRILYPFAGAGSEIIGGIKAGFDNWDGCELNQDYVDIANARIEYYTNKEKEEQEKIEIKNQEVELF